MTKIFAILKPQREFELCNTFFFPSPTKTTHLKKRPLRKKTGWPLNPGLQGWVCGPQGLTHLPRLLCSWGVPGWWFVEMPWPAQEPKLGLPHALHRNPVQAGRPVSWGTGPVPYLGCSLCQPAESLGRNPHTLPKGREVPCFGIL